MSRLREIAFLRPDTSESRTFLREVQVLLGGVAYANSRVSPREPGATVDRLTLTPPRPIGAKPVTTFKVADVPAPKVTFDTGQSIGVRGSSQPTPHTLPGRIELAELTRRIAGHVQRVDHTGVNLPAGATSPEQWQSLVGALSATSTMYRYPDEEWPFILPSTSAERDGDIRDFVVGREPRFELVYDRWLTQTQWQFAFWTDLTRADLELLFPEPEGITFPGLDEIFRVVPVRLGNRRVAGHRRRTHPLKPTPRSGSPHREAHTGLIPGGPLGAVPRSSRRRSSRVRGCRR